MLPVTTSLAESRPELAIGMFSVSAEHIGEVRPVATSLAAYMEAGLLRLDLLGADITVTLLLNLLSKMKENDLRMVIRGSTMAALACRAGVANLLQPCTVAAVTACNAAADTDCLVFRRTWTRLASI